MIFNDVVFYERKDGSYVAKGDGFEYGINKDDEKCLYPYSKVKKHIAENPEALIPEPKPPKPTPEHIAEAKRRAALAQLDELDRKSARYLRASIAGTIDEEGKKRLAAIEAEAKTLRATL